MQSHRRLAYVIALSSCLSALAAERKAVDGAGAVGCGKYLEVRRENDRASALQFAQWSSGFLSSYNLFASERPIPPDRMPDGATISAYLDKYCRANPLDKVYHGVVELLGELGGRKPWP
ncbi:hypothetical protein FBR04_19380 [Betaproteobacteria bacterium PRO7]|nr:hypothetical protein [Betaproteobacteria bacterium PRO7]